MNIINKIEKILEKIEHKMLKDIYTGKQKAITIKRKGLRKDSPKRQLVEFTLNRIYLKNYGKIKQEMTNEMMFGGEISKTNLEKKSEYTSDKDEQDRCNLTKKIMGYN